jgi:SAM-dependent methyltransferase
LDVFTKAIHRLTQLRSLFLSHEFYSETEMLDGVAARFNEDAEVRYYRGLALAGLEPYESEAVEAVPRGGRALVLGCGGGREAFALEKRGFAVTTTDRSPAMLAGAREMAAAIASGVVFEEGTWPRADEKFDLILVTTGLINHLPGRANRVHFLREGAARLRDGSTLCFFPDIYPFTGFDRYRLGSAALRLRAALRLGRWEPGDTVRSYLGEHNRTPSLVYYHYYRDVAEVEGELSAAGLRARTLPLGFLLAGR